MIAFLTSWPAGILVGLAIAGLLWRWRRSVLLSAVGLFATILVVVYAVPSATRARAIAKSVETEQAVDRARVETSAAVEETKRLRARVAALEAKQRALLAKVAESEARDREHARRRLELDQVVIPPAQAVEGRDQVVEVFRRYAQ